MGDFNLDLLKHDKHLPTEKFLDVMYANSFTPTINRPTRVTKDTCTLIDNIYTNHYNIKYDKYSAVLTTDITDHFPVFHVSKLHCDHPIDKEYKTIRIINEHRKLKFMEKIQNMDSTSLDSFQDCQTYFSNLLKLFKNTHDESFPITRVKIKYRNRLLWLSDGLKSSIRHKNQTISNITKTPNYS